jgi:hypothetical protein
MTSSLIVGVCITMVDECLRLQLDVQWIHVFKEGNSTCSKTTLGGILVFVFLLLDHNHFEISTLDNKLENGRFFDGSLAKNWVNVGLNGSCIVSHSNFL